MPTDWGQMQATSCARGSILWYKSHVTHAPQGLSTVRLRLGSDGLANLPNVRNVQGMVFKVTVEAAPAGYMPVRHNITW